MSWKVRLPMMCKLAFHTVCTVQAVASWSLSNTHLISPSGPPTKPSIDMDIFKIRSLIACSLYPNLGHAVHTILQLFFPAETSLCDKQMLVEPRVLGGTGIKGQGHPHVVIFKLRASPFLGRACKQLVHFNE